MTVFPIVRVDFCFDTAMWNEQFHLAQFPWLRLYTDNTKWASKLPRKISSLDSRGQQYQDYIIKVDSLAQLPSLPDAERRQFSRYVDEQDDGWGDFDPESTEDLSVSKRFQLLLNASDSDLDGIVSGRISSWPGL